MRSVEEIILEQHERRMVQGPKSLPTAKPHRPKMSEKTMAEARRLIAEGLTHREAGKRLGIAASSVARAVKP